MKRELTIIVSGPARSGKSTMVVWLEKQLEKKGFDVEIDLKPEIEDYGTETQFREVMAFDRKQKLNKIKTEVRITLKQKCMASGSKKKTSNGSKEKTNKNN
jgi:nucleoside-triphosphatase THEP1